MSLSAPPSQHHSLPPPRPAPPLTLKARLRDEYRHWDEMPVLRLCLLLLPTSLLLAISPLLPLVAYALWLWASHSWDWRDRWVSIWAWAKQGSAIVALVLVFTVLSSTQVWVLPQLTAALQAFWHAHLGGDLSLSPTDLDGFVARTLLLLPLAPALALLYERIDPRTRVQLQRVLTPADLAEPAIASPPGTPRAAPPPPRTKAQAAPASKAKAARPPRKRKREPTQQITIDSFLAQEPTQAASPSPSRQAAEQPVPPSPAPEAPPQPPNARTINWDDVAN